MEKKNILNLGVIIILGLGCLTACKSKSYPPPDSSQSIDFPSSNNLINSTSEVQQYESKGLKIKLYGDARYDKSKNQVSVNNGGVWVSFLDKNEASEKPFKILTDRFGLIVINPTGTEFYMRVREGFFQVDALIGSINLTATNLSTQTYTLNSGKKLFWHNNLKEPQITQISKTEYSELKDRLSKLDECKKKPGCLENLRSARNPKSEPNTAKQPSSFRDTSESPRNPNTVNKPHPNNERLPRREPFKKQPNRNILEGAKRLLPRLLRKLRI
ncbi:MAG TPA: hypothetical protein IGS40_12970 [Trichormus sp. M33_DOE_039]|nr:hypothetical protein [Trichormus sp. M33_DOE_039]